MGSYPHENMTFSQRFLGHLKTVSMHKYYVAQGCFKIGLYFQGIFHDTSKFYPCEFFMGVKYYDGHRSPNAVERELNEGASTAWMHHKGRNKHHYEYWTDFSAFKPDKVYGCRMPLKYVAEMVCDRTAACKAYHPGEFEQADPWIYYERFRDRIVMHKDTRAVLEKALVTMRDEGEDACFAYLKGLLAITKGRDYTAGSLGLSYDPLY